MELGYEDEFHHEFAHLPLAEISKIQKCKKVCNY